ncbi:hypothetical protein Patl1_34383 [Pistacia atlantica]|uniref:Uncharacterized protein n=1 Tax=Pistacia atlantica TaxID=434234 RepID=A0ACC0ZVY6_9ROSI|nr:hypothetical protein Patl1_34383 [Pistacia atlantica]
MTEVLGLTIAHAVWLALENSFSHISKTRELHIKDDLQLIKRGTRSVTEYSCSFKALCDQLTAMGYSVDDTDKVHYYLRGLGTDFANFSTTHMSLTPLPAFKDLVPKGESFEIFQKSRWSSSPVSSTTFTATNGSFPSSQGGSSSKSLRSRSGHNVGHGHGRGKQGFYTPWCQIFFDWFTDTDASAHMTPNPSQLDKVEPYHGKDCVVVGNGMAVAKGKREGGLYVLERGKSAFVSVLRNKNLHASFELWHARLGHVPPPPCHFCADDPSVEPLQVSSSTMESPSPSAAVSPAPASVTDLVPPTAPMDPIHATT